MKAGCLDDGGWLDVNKATVFIGDQGSGKSTVAKAIATMSWLEKVLNRGDIKPDELNFRNYTKHFEFQGIRDYLKQETEICYVGRRFSITLNVKEKRFEVEDTGGNGYIVPKIMYVPAERNFLSTIKDAYGVKSLPEHLFAFAEELRKAQKKDAKKVGLPIPGYHYKYDDKKDVSYIMGKDHEINLLHAASGFQALIPLFLVTRFLANSTKNNKEYHEHEMLSVQQSVRMKQEMSDVMADAKISDAEKQFRIETIRRKFINKCFFNIVEEPEQNLFPASQKHLLYSLLKYNSYSASNKLLITTHSPYMINFLSLAIQGHYLNSKIKEAGRKDDLLPKLDSVVPLQALIASKQVSIYEMNEADGTIKKLPDVHGIPSGKNYLNGMIRTGNVLFDKLLEIEEEL